MSDAPNPDDRVETLSRNAQNPYATWNGLHPIEVPPGLVVLPGPQFLRRTRGAIGLRVYRYPGCPSVPAAWFAVVNGTGLGGRLVAAGSDYDALHVYLVERFHPCSISHTPPPVRKPFEGQNPAAGNEGV